MNEPSRRSPVVKLWLGVLLLALVGYTGYSLARMYWQRSAEASVAPVTVPQPLVGQTIRDFRLVERNGKEFDSASLRGRPWVASFFFCGCAGACLRMNNTLAGLQHELKDVPVTLVSITVDPTNDTPQRLRDYARHYQADRERWVFLTGDQATIQRVAVEDFHVAYATAVHSDRLILVGPDGRVVRHYRSAEPTDVALLKRDLRKLAEAAE